MIAWWRWRLRLRRARIAERVIRHALASGDPGNEALVLAYALARRERTGLEGLR